MISVTQEVLDCIMLCRWLGRERFIVGALRLA